MKMHWKKLMMSCVVLSAPTVMAQDTVNSGQGVPMNDVVMVDKTTIEPSSGDGGACNIAGGFLIGNGCSVLGNISGNISNDQVANNIL